LKFKGTPKGPNQNATMYLYLNLFVKGQGGANQARVHQKNLKLFCITFQLLYP